MEHWNVSINSSTAATETTSGTYMMMNVTDVGNYSSTAPTPTQVLLTPLDELVFQDGVTVAFIIAYAVVMVPAVIGNLFIIFAVAFHPDLRSQHSNTYNINLAVCDLMVVAAECPLMILQFLIRGETAESFFTDSVCRLTFLLNGFFGTVSILTMLAIGVERYCAVMHPLQMIGENTATRARSVIFFFWSFSILTHLGQLAIYGEVKTWHYINSDGERFDVTICMSSRPEQEQVFAHIYATTVFILVYGSTFLTTLVLYIRILQHLIKRKSVSPDQILEAGNAPSTRRRGKKKHVAPKTCTEAVQKTFRMLSCSVLSYLICYSLYFYINLYYIYYGLSEWNGMALILIGNWFGALNSLINPIVYAVFVGQFCTVFKAILTGSWRRRRSSSSTIQIRMASGGRSENRRVRRPKPKPGSTRRESRVASIDGQSSITDRL
ncbi:neuromedin-U receptor 2-like [Patiria miniata]|uniref:G-protein coupled receptors family 1 profile domain-containing protein n=1 Tax=Patiria miniata TaxID=46514 RepID=A0A914BDD3_PATMI|nr:neuromedin-U receptor 2-like [Patiria miniata]